MAELSITFATFVPYLRRFLSFGPADYFGSLVAHHDLLVWSLRSGVVDHAQIYCEQTPAFDGISAVFDRAKQALSDLPPAIRDRVSVQAVTSLHPARFPNSFFVGRTSEFSQLVQLRRASGVFFPVCAITHAVSSPNLVGVFASVLLQAEVCDTIVVTSRAAEHAISSLIEQTREFLAEVHPQAAVAVRGPSVVWIPLGVDDSLLKTLDKRTCRETLGLAESDVVVLYVGRLSTEYKADLEPLLSGFRTMFSNRPEVKLLLAGNDPAQNTLTTYEQLLKSEGATRQVRIISNFAPNLKRLIYSAADIFVSPVDNIQETCGLSIIEAMACGLPVVASNWSGYRDLVDSNSGFLIDTLVAPHAFSSVDRIASCAVVPYAEAFLARSTVVDWHSFFDVLVRLVGDRELRIQLGRGGREKVAHEYRWTEVMAKFKQLWHTQVLQARQCRVGARRKHIRYREMFGCYPSHVPDMDMLICDSRGLAHVRQLFGSSTLHSKIAEQCAAKPVPLREFAQHAPSTGRDAVYELLKNGLLRLVRTGEKA